MRRIDRRSRNPADPSGMAVSRSGSIVMRERRCGRGRERCEPALSRMGRSALRARKGKT